MLPSSPPGKLPKLCSWILCNYLAVSTHFLSLVQVTYIEGEVTIGGGGECEDEAPPVPSQTPSKEVQ